MKTELIVMLTHHDRTVQNALELFDALQKAPIVHWGFKDIGLPPGEMKKLVRKMRDAGKTTYLEVVSLSEEAGLQGAQLAVEAGFDVLMGTVYFAAIHQYLKDKPIKYYPFPGHVHDHPSILDGSIQEIVQHARFSNSGSGWFRSTRLPLHRRCGISIGRCGSRHNDTGRISR